MADSPSPIVVMYSVARALRVRHPRPGGSARVEHFALADVLTQLRSAGVAGLASQRSHLAAYRKELESADPDSLGRDHALAYWLNLYNAGALDLAAETYQAERTSVLRTPGAFGRRWATVAGETLSLDDIEHGKIRRFGDPRIHAALVCGSASCPTLRLEPYEGDRIEAQLDAQMRSFLSNGGAVQDGSRLLLSRIFLWYGADFVKPRRMPTFAPVRKGALRRALEPWLGFGDGATRIEFQPYDWGLACSIG